jgi:hypothetical protein
MATPRLTPQEQLSRAKLRALAQGVRVWALETGQAPRYAVPSTSNDGTAYEVVVHGTAGPTCNCPSAVNRGICKHIGAVLVRLDVEREMARVQRSSEHLERDLAELYS